MPEIDQIRKFWETNPLFAGETAAPTGTRKFFEDHRRVYIEDCFAGRLDERLWPKPENCDSVLDLGCGPGFWTVELLQRQNIGRMVAADLTSQALNLTRTRLDLYGLQAETRIENAEEMTFENGVFGHINCQGVIHHTPRTEKAIKEISRVLREGGTAVLSVYFLNAILRNWKYLSWLGSILHRVGAKMPGRGRDCLYLERDVLEIVRLYDGAANPLGKAYTCLQFATMLAPHFHIDEIYYHFFPARSLPIRIPKEFHLLLDSKLPFMIYANVRKLHRG